MNNNSPNPNEKFTVVKKVSQINFRGKFEFYFQEIVIMNKTF